MTFPVATESGFVRSDPFGGLGAALRGLLEAPGTGATTVVPRRVGTNTQVSPDSAYDRHASPALIVGQIRTSFGISIADLARILGVERPTVYAWLRDETTPQSANMQRLSEIARLANHWQRLSPAPLGSRLHHPNGAGQTMFEVLTKDDVSVDEALVMLDALASGVDRHVPGLKSRGLSLFAAPDGLAEIDRITGRSVAPED